MESQKTWTTTEDNGVNTLHGIFGKNSGRQRKTMERKLYMDSQKTWTTTENNGAKTLHGISKNLDDNRRHWSENFTWNLWKKLWTTTEVVEKLYLVISY